MKSKKSISYNTDPITMNNAAIAAMAMGVSTEEIVRRAIREFSCSIESEKLVFEGRCKASTVDIYDPDTTKILKDAVAKSSLTRSTVIHKCLKKYLEYYRLDIKRNLEMLGERLNQVAKTLAA